jgi:hypothetical protein
MNRLFSYLISILILSSCGTKVKEINYSVPPKNTKELIARVNAKNNYPEWLSLKGKVNFTKDNQDITLNINIKNRKDSVIWVSFKAPFGIELFRVQLTPDSIYFVNRTNKSWLIKPVSHIKEFLKVDISFKEVQEMITANPRIITKKLKFENTDDQFLLSSYFFTYVISDFYRIKYAKLIGDKHFLEYTFDSFQAENNFPTKFSLNVKAEESFEATLIYSKVVFNKPQKLSFKIPSNYVEVE